MTGGPIRIVHAIPGRVRLKVDQLKNNPSLAQVIRERLGAVPGIKAVEARPLTASVLVCFDPEAVMSPASLMPLSETLTDLFPDLDQTGLAEFLSQAAGTEAADLSLGERITDFWVGLSGELAGFMGGLVDFRFLIPLVLLFFGLPRIIKK
jgi:hypothetical protein